jgi:hypothetical protein
LGGGGDKACYNEHVVHPSIFMAYIWSWLRNYVKPFINNRDYKYPQKLFNQYVRDHSPQIDIDFSEIFKHNDRKDKDFFVPICWKLISIRHQILSK